ncbi:Hypothetical protein, putative, partial [Bodo saltans]
MPTHPVTGHSFVPLPTPSPLGSCDQAGRPLITVDPASHSEALIYFANIVNSDIASKIAISLIILCVALASGVLPMRVIARAQHQEHHHGEAAGGNRIHRFLHAMVKYGNSFSAGVFLAMGIVHLMPEASRAFTAVYGERYVERYHPGELFVLMGYVLILALHRVVFPTPTCPHALEGGDSHGHSHGHGHSHDDGEEPQHSHSTSHRHQRHHHVRVSRGNSPPPPLVPPTSADPDVECRELLNMAFKVAATYGATDLQTATASRPPPQTVTTASANLSRTSVSRQTVCCRSAKHCVDVAQHGGGGGGSVTSGMSPLIPLLSPFPIEKNGSFEAHSINSENNNKDYYGGGGGGGDDEGTTGGVDHLLLDRTERIANAGGHSMGWTLVVALSVHAICEGLALGLQCGPQNVLMLGCAICSHKWAESFALSSSLIHQAVAPHHHDDDESSEHHEDGDHYQTRAAALEEEMAIQRAWKIVVLFALATPVGALLGGVMH